MREELDRLCQCGRKMNRINAAEIPNPTGVIIAWVIKFLPLRCTCGKITPALGQNENK